MAKYLALPSYDTLFGYIDIHCILLQWGVVCNDSGVSGWRGGGVLRGMFVGEKVMHGCAYTYIMYDILKACFNSVL